jgi:methylated-DNA-[protein]-cysteine S-methyltransferase
MTKINYANPMNIPNHDAKLTFDSPVGAITLFSKDNKVVLLTMGSDITPDFGKASVLNDAKKQLQDYFKGKTKALSFPVALGGTKFQQSVWSEIEKIGFGEVTTYAEIAKNIGNPKAVRAVGGAVGSNPVPLVIGCHRVLGASGRITGYSGGDGIPTKRWLLELEGIETTD